MAAASRSLSIPGLRALLEAGVKIRSLRRLHAKVFIADQDFGLVGSGNLTSPGLGVGGGPPNVEAGLLMDESERTVAAEKYQAWWHQARAVKAQHLDDLERAAAELEAQRPPGALAPSARRVADQLIADAGAVQAWLKAEDNSLVDANMARLGPTSIDSPDKGRPSFAIGDLVFVYAKYAKRANVILEISSVAFIHSDPQQAKWPWRNEAVGRLQVPARLGLTIPQLGVSPYGLENGHVRMTTEEFVRAICLLGRA